VSDTGIGCLQTKQTEIRLFLFFFWFAFSCAPFCSEEYLPEETGKERNDAVVGEKEPVLAEQRPPGLERLEFSLEFLDADDAADELDACPLEEIFVFALWVFGNKTDSRNTRIDERVLDGAIVSTV